MSERQDMGAQSLSERLHYTATERCSCGHGFAYDPQGQFFTESNSPFVMRPDQWECAGTLLYRAEELPEDEAARVLAARHDRPISFSIGIKGQTPELSTKDAPHASK